MIILRYRYILKVEVKRGLLQRDIITRQEIYLEKRPILNVDVLDNRKSPILEKMGKTFVMSPNTIKVKMKRI